MVWCRRGDSNPHELPHTPLKRARLPVPPLRLKLSDNDCNATYLACDSRLNPERLYFVPVGEAACEAAGEATGAVVAAGDATGAGVGVASGAVDCKTEWEPVTPGSESINAKSIKPAAAPIVIFERILAVPRGPNAVLDTLLENKSPAPDLPGCKSTTITKTTQDRINS